jgi:hypothetical protein
MEIPGFSKAQIAALIEMWNLSTPINVIAFFDRSDIPDDAKRQVQQAGTRVGGGIQAEADAYRRMQVQIVIEVAKLDKQR